MLNPDLFEPMFGPDDSQRAMVRNSRSATFILALTALLVSLSFPGVVNLVVFSMIVAGVAAAAE
jgi:Na+/proline symporter